MHNTQLSPPVMTATTAPTNGDNRFRLDIEAQLLTVPPVKPVHLSPPSHKLCEGDLDDQRFDQSLKGKVSSTTLGSSCTTLCNSTVADMEDPKEPASKLPPPKGSTRYQAFRWRFFTPYQKLFAVVMIANFIPMVIMLVHIGRTRRPTGARTRRDLANILTAVSINLTASIAIRNEHVVNLLFRIFVTHVSPRWPLWIRRRLAKVYHLGGVHSGGGVAAIVWYGIYSAVTLHDFVDNWTSGYDQANLALSCVIWLLMCGLLAAAIPHVRAKLHNLFEVTHRFCGWLILILFWVQTLLFCFISSGKEAGPSIVQIPTFWALIIMTLTVAYPWLRVKRLEVRCEKLSEHAIRMHIEDRKVMAGCRVVSISHSPLRETHKFAVIPTPKGQTGYSMVISRAGDWTSSMIANPPKKIWIKGTPAWGVIRVATMFDPVVIVATGSGIGPCLGLFSGYPQAKCRVLWQTRNPEKTYGKEILNMVRSADKDAVIIDTSVTGRQDMVLASYNLYRESKAEAVIVISNTTGTYQIVRGLEARGIPAYGPIRDS
jgi:NAD(P)H-flavin reductase